MVSVNVGIVVKGVLMGLIRAMRCTGVVVERDQRRRIVTISEPSSEELGMKSCIADSLSSILFMVVVFQQLFYIFWKIYYLNPEFEISGIMLIFLCIIIDLFIIELI